MDAMARTELGDLKRSPKTRQKCVSQAMVAASVGFPTRTTCPVRRKDRAPVLACPVGSTA